MFGFTLAAWWHAHWMEAMNIMTRCRGTERKTTPGSNCKSSSHHHSLRPNRPIEFSACAQVILINIAESYFPLCFSHFIWCIGWFISVFQGKFQKIWFIWRKSKNEKLPKRILEFFELKFSKSVIFCFFMCFQSNANEDFFLLPAHIPLETNLGRK